MGELQRRGNRAPRAAREQRAYRLVVTGGTASLIAVAGVVLAVLGIIGGTIPALAVLVALTCAVLFWRTVS